MKPTIATALMMIPLMSAPVMQADEAPEAPAPAAAEPAVAGPATPANAIYLEAAGSALLGLTLNYERRVIGGPVKQLDARIGMGALASWGGGGIVPAAAIVGLRRLGEGSAHRLEYGVGLAPFVSMYHLRFEEVEWWNPHLILGYRLQSDRKGRGILRASLVISPTIDTVVWPGLSGGIVF